MRLTNFTFYSSIEIGISGRPRFLDLHNTYGWRSFNYRPELRQIRMTWILRVHGQVQADLPPVVTLEFRGVSRFAAPPHDPEMPYDEDNCLDSVTFTLPEHTSEKSELKVFRSDSGHVAFLFRSGFGLKIWAEEASCFMKALPNKTAGSAAWKSQVIEMTRAVLSRRSGWTRLWGRCLMRTPDTFTAERSY